MQLPKFVFMSLDFLKKSVHFVCFWTPIVDKAFNMLKDAPSGYLCFPSISI